MTDQKPDPSNAQSVSELEDMPRNTDPHEVYDSVSSLPTWWRTVVEEFSEHDLRPYRPPQFKNGVIAPPVISMLERRYDTDIQLLAIDPRLDDDWTVYIDGNELMEIGHRRKPAGYTVYDTTAEELESAIDEYTNS